MRKLSAFAQEKGSHLPPSSQTNTQTRPLPSWALASDTPLTGLTASVPLRPREELPTSQSLFPCSLQGRRPKRRAEGPALPQHGCPSQSPQVGPAAARLWVPSQEGQPSAPPGGSPDPRQSMRTEGCHHLSSPVGDPPQLQPTPLPAPLSSTPFQPTPGQGRRGPLQPLVGLEDSLPFSHCFYPSAVPFLLGSAQCRLLQEASLDHPRSL